MTQHFLCVCAVCCGYVLNGGTESLSTQQNGRNLFGECGKSTKTHLLLDKEGIEVRNALNDLKVWLYGIVWGEESEIEVFNAYAYI